MARILSVSYDESLLKTRQLILEQSGYEVTSALGFTDAMKQCTEGGTFDMFVLGHSIPIRDKQALVQAFRCRCRSAVVALKRPGEDLAATGADFQADPGDPAGMLALISQIIQARATTAA
jgi:DNA-binding NtrC family response regulator